MAQPERAELIRRIEGARGARLLCFLTSDRQNASQQIQKDVMPLFYEHLRQMGSTERIDVFIYTLGGDTLAAFGIGRLLREFAGWVGALVPEKCYSAGTLFVVGANEIVMTRAATLSPFDPSIVRPLNPAVEMAPGKRQLLPISVESVAGFKGLVTEDWNIKGEEALTSAFRTLAEKVHPLALGDVYRSRQQIELLATKLLNEHRPGDEMVPRIVMTLTKDLGSHDYLISRREARELLGKQIAPENLEVEDLIWELYQDFAAEMELRVPYDGNTILQEAATKAGGSLTAPIKVLHRLAIVESLHGSHVAEKEVQLTETKIPVPGPVPGVMMPIKGVQEEPIRAGWKFYKGTERTKSVETGGKQPSEKDEKPRSRRKK
ncbi:MAG TPA: hypothetical protein VMF69_24540 [Gemmataceae bacterium]|nr:hypothetical protein [Gemmataceae bacterium]